MGDTPLLRCDCFDWFRVWGSFPRRGYYAVDWGGIAWPPWVGCPSGPGRWTFTRSCRLCGRSRTLISRIIPAASEAGLAMVPVQQLLWMGIATIWCVVACVVVVWKWSAFRDGFTCWVFFGFLLRHGSSASVDGDCDNLVHSCVCGGGLDMIWVFGWNYFVGFFGFLLRGVYWCGGVYYRCSPLRRKLALVPKFRHRNIWLSTATRGITPALLCSLRLTFEDDQASHALHIPPFSSSSQF